MQFDPFNLHFDPSVSARILLHEKDLFVQFIHVGYAASIESASSTGSGSHSLQCIPASSIGRSVANTSVISGPKMSAVKFNLLGVAPSQHSTRWTSVNGKRLHCAVCLESTSEMVINFSFLSSELSIMSSLGGLVETYSGDEVWR